MTREKQLLSEIGLIRTWFTQEPRSYPSVDDPTHKRFVDVVLNRADHQASDLEVCVLIRQILKRSTALGQTNFSLSTEWGLTSEVLSEVGILTVPLVDSKVELVLSEWQPKFLETSDDYPAVDESSLVGLDRNRRAQFLSSDEEIIADKDFELANGHATYRSLGQLSVTRSAICLEPGGTLIGVLPTGSGKTDVAATVIFSEYEKNKRTSVIVVPTTALAIDLERRFRELISKYWVPGAPEDLPLAWTVDTKDDVRETITDRIRSGSQPVLITSPEAIARARVGEALADAAQAGLLGWFVVDEAHMIIEWGTDFRMEFAELGPIARSLIQVAKTNEVDPCRVLLLSATLTTFQIAQLGKIFEDCAPIRLVAANKFRPEPEIWVAQPCTPEERTKRLIEALKHLPRPLLVYVTKPAKANELLQTLRDEGFLRSDVFSGKTVGADRRIVLTKLRGDDGATELDIVIATSAFGLGVDFEELRCVVHACIPETVGRWYQEIGRAGRDGYASTAMWLPALGDMNEAMSLGVQRLTPPVAMSHWKAMLEGLKLRDGRYYIDLHAASETVTRGSYNRRWNSQILVGLERIGLLKRLPISWTESKSKRLDVEPIDEIVPEWVGIEPIALHGRRTIEDIDEAFEPSGQWEKWKTATATLEGNAFKDLEDMTSSRKAICSVIANEFEPPWTHVERKKYEGWTFDGLQSGGLKISPPCGRCPTCRAEKRRTRRSSDASVGSHWSPFRELPNDRVPTVVIAEAEEIEEVMAFLVEEKGVRHIVWPDCPDDFVIPEGCLFLDRKSQGIRLTPKVSLAQVVSEYWPTLETELRMASFPDVPTYFIVTPSFDEEKMPNYQLTHWETWRRNNVDK